MENGKMVRKAMTAFAVVFALAVWARAEDKPAAKPAENEAGASEAASKTRLDDWAKGVLIGYRATAIPVSGNQVMFLKKGDRVDVLVTFDAQMKTSKEKVTATILQNCVVTEVYRPADAEKMGVVQLLLNPNEAQYAALAYRQGELSVTLRAPNDTEMHPMEMASFRKLFR
jgi:hypothetical protein